MSPALSHDEEFLLDDTSVLAILAECDMANKIMSLPVDGSTLILEQVQVSMSSNKVADNVLEKAVVEKKKTWRQRRKEEVVSLEEEVKKLSAELYQLKAAASVFSTLPATGEEKFKTLARIARKSGTLSMWEQIAGRQSLLRQRSEDENKTLRELAMRHVKQAKALRCAVRRKLREASLAIPVTRSRVDLRGLSPPLNNKTVFENLMAGMDDISSNLDGFFTEVGMDQMQCPDRKRILMGNSKGNVVIEFLDTYVVPFGLYQTENVVCNPSRTSSQDKGIFYLQNFTQDTNTEMISMCFPFSLEGVNFRIVMRIVTRKYSQQNKVVFITRSLIEPIIGTASIAFVETSRMVLKRGNISALGSTTVMQTHREATLSGDVLSLDLTKYPGLEGGIQAWQDTTTDYYHSIEDQLLLTVE